MINCSKCPKRGDCCGIIPFNKELIKKHKDKFQVEVQKEVDMGEEVSFITEDLFCIFLNRQTKLCMIYEDRPRVCKLYGVTKNKDLQCPYFRPSGNKRSPASRKQIERHIDKMTNNIINHDKKIRIQKICPRVFRD